MSCIAACKRPAHAAIPVLDRRDDDLPRPPSTPADRAAHPAGHTATQVVLVLQPRCGHVLGAEQAVVPAAAMEVEVELGAHPERIANIWRVGKGASISRRRCIFLLHYSHYASIYEV